MHIFTFIKVYYYYYYVVDKLLIFEYEEGH